jgi:putative hydrolase
MDPVAALQRVLHCLDRAHDTSHRTRAFSRALDVARSTPPEELQARAAAGTLTDLPGIGAVSAKVITEALAGEVPSYLVKLEQETVLPMSPEAAALRTRLRGDLHSHTRWSDGGASLDDMVRTAQSLGHEYLVVTDHSPRLTVAHGLDRERLGRQLDEIAALQAVLDEEAGDATPFRILTGMEVDINTDGTLDLDDDLLARLDVVVASVHSKLRMERSQMTERMVLAVASPHVDVLGHCTGRLIGKRPESAFDADYVFAACAQLGTAVEINSRPERLDPPAELLDLAMQHGCLFAIDSDAHATGQLEWQPHGCEKAVTAGVPAERIINTWAAGELLAWTAHR